MAMVKASFDILESLKLPNNLYKASASSVYNRFWIRDAIYIILAYKNKSCGQYEKTLHAMFDIFKEYEWKLDIHTNQKPKYIHEYIHPRYDLEGKEIDQEWGNCQHDAIGAFMWAVGTGEKEGKQIIRDNKDREILQKLVWYLNTCEYWEDPDNGMWEEWREVHASSVGACTAGLMAISDLVYIPSEIYIKGQNKLKEMFPVESHDRPVDLSLLSLIYPYKLLNKSAARVILNNIEEKLVRERGVARYEGDSYHVLDKNRDLPMCEYYGHEAEWTMGFPWLSICFGLVGDLEKSRYYLKKTYEVSLEDGRLPELYYAKTDRYNENNPLGWSNALFIVAKEKLGKLE